MLLCRQIQFFMRKTVMYDAVTKLTAIEKMKVVNFLYENLQEYGDPKKDIQKAIDYSIKEISSAGGFTLVLSEDDKIKGVVVINKTGMGGYIPENILVYIATHQDHRGEGLGKALMEKAIQFTKGDIALHVEPNNPAIKLYEKFGFTNPYLEMRLKK